MRAPSALAAFSLALRAASTPVAPLAAASTLIIDGAALAQVYDGHGGLSAGASSRLLWDYPPAQRADILDFLFTPQHGLSLHLLKMVRDRAPAARSARAA